MTRRAFCIACMAMSGSGSVALVCGGSRGVGRGCAVGLGEAGMTVWVTGRTEEEHGGPVPLAGSVASTAAAVTSAGGRGVARRCDHADDAAVERLFSELLAEERRLDLGARVAHCFFEQLHNECAISRDVKTRENLAEIISRRSRGTEKATHLFACRGITGEEGQLASEFGLSLPIMGAVD